MRRVRSVGRWLPLAAAVLAGCGQDDTPAPKAALPAASVAPAPADAPARVAGGDAGKGRQIWLGQCVACHNIDPARDGPVGPAVKGSPAPLLLARLQRAGYPEGYTPKRDSKVMPARPDLVASVPDLAAYLR